MRVIKKRHASTKYFSEDIHHVERCGLKGRAKSYIHKSETEMLFQPRRSVAIISDQIRKLLNRIRREACR